MLGLTGVGGGTQLQTAASCSRMLLLTYFLTQQSLLLVLCMNISLLFFFSFSGRKRGKGRDSQETNRSQRVFVNEHGKCDCVTVL